MKPKSHLLAAMLFGAALAAGGCSNLGQKSTGEATVQLSGFAKSAAEAERAAQIARSVNGVRMVKNDIRLTQ